MKSLIFMVVVIAAIGVLIAFVKRQKEGVSNPTEKEKPTAREPLTQREIGMFIRLKEAFPEPEFVVLAQVSFSALITAEAKGVRNTFDRKTADFVICNSAFRVVAEIELDDSSHKEKRFQDEARDKLLTNAGYRVLRYKQVPDTARLRSDIKRT